MPTGEQVALRQAQRAIDDAVRSIFELAVQLEVLSDVISHFKDETRREQRERQDAIIGATVRV